MPKIIYTTYFNNLMNLPDNIVPIAICGKSPIDYSGREYKRLAPKYDFFQQWKKTRDNQYYIDEFNKRVLYNLDPDEVINELFVGIDQSDTIALVCYEKPNEFCHRHLVADWLKSNGYNVVEYHY